MAAGAKRLEHTQRQPVLFAAGTASMASATSRYIQPIVQSWQGSTSFNKVPVCMSIRVMLELMQDAQTNEEQGIAATWASGYGGALPGAVFVACDDDTPRSLIDHLIDMLRQSMLGGVIVVEDAASWLQGQEEREGVMLVGRSTPPQVIAGMLYTLCERQSVVRRLSREHDLTKRCEGLIRGEMERMHHELQLAASIQQEFTSRPMDVIPALDHSLLFRPVNFVSGDVCCLRELADGQVAFFVADAAGHGVPAALLTMVLSNAMDSIDGTCMESRDGARLNQPSEVMESLNRRVCSHCRSFGWFATAIYGVLDTHSGTLLVSGAGHPPPLILGRGGSRREVETQGPVLGIDNSSEFPQVQEVLQPDEALLVYTDGLEGIFPGASSDEPMQLLRERPHMAHLFALAQEIEEAFLQDVNTDASTVTRRLAGMLDEQSGSLHQGDDVTALVLKRKVAQSARLAA